MEGSVLASVPGRRRSRELEPGRVVDAMLGLLRSHGPMLLAFSLATAGAVAFAPVLLERDADIAVRLSLGFCAGVADLLLVSIAAAALYGGEVWRRLPQRLPWALAVGLTAGLGQAFGYLLLVVPGLILTTMWLAAVPAEIVERKGFSALNRSAELTRGHRWVIFGLLVAFGLASWLLSAIGGLAAIALAGASTRALPFLAQAGVEVVTSLLGAVGTAALYRELKESADGPEVSAVADVFD